MTMRYAHAGDREIETAAERVGKAIARLLLVQAAASSRLPRYGSSQLRRLGREPAEYSIVRDGRVDKHPEHRCGMLAERAARTYACTGTGP